MSLADEGGVFEVGVEDAVSYCGKDVRTVCLSLNVITHTGGESRGRSFRILESGEAE